MSKLVDKFNGGHTVDAIQYNGRNETDVLAWAVAEFGRELDMEGCRPDTWFYHDPQHESGPLCMTDRGVQFNFTVIEGDNA